MPAREDTAAYDFEWSGRPEPWVLPFLKDGIDTLIADTERGEVLAATVKIRIRRPKTEEEDE